MPSAADSNQKKYRLAVIAPTPFYYHVPLYQKVTDYPNVSLTVYFCSDETLRGADVEKTYHAKGSFINKSELLNGYGCAFLKNYSPAASYLNWPFGLMNFGVWNEIKRGKYDAVVLQAWTNVTWLLAFFACMRFGTPVLFMTDSNVSAEYGKPKWKVVVKKALLEKFLFKKAAGFLTSGTANEQFYAHYGVSSEKMVRLPFSWGYDDLIKKVETVTSRRQAIRQSLGILSNDMVILYVGRLAKEKSLFTLLKAFARIPQKNKKLFLVGDGLLRKEIEEKVHELKLNNIVIAGFQSRAAVLDFYAAADALVLPSVAETWGMVVNEAMCFGLPVVVSDQVGAGVDLVRDGVNGFVFAAGNEDDLLLKLTALMNLSDAERSRFGEASKKMITDWIQSLTLENQMPKMLKLFRK